MFLVYVSAKDPEIVIKYPDAKGDTKGNLYIDDNNVCYRYKKEVVKCKNA